MINLVFRYTEALTDSERSIRRAVSKNRDMKNFFFLNSKVLQLGDLSNSQNFLCFLMLKFLKNLVLAICPGNTDEIERESLYFSIVNLVDPMFVP